jgi:mono/diheme cytochrome c family protein
VLDIEKAVDLGFRGSRRLITLLPRRPHFFRRPTAVAIVHHGCSREPAAPTELIMIHTRFVSFLFAIAVSACGGNAPKHSSDPAVLAEAKEVWETRCVTCHGPQGMGNGLNAKSLKTTPRSFRDGSWQSETTDERIKQVIVQGGASVGLSAEMKANPDLADKPAVVEELLAMVRSLGG